VLNELVGGRERDASRIKVSAITIFIRCFRARLSLLFFPPRCTSQVDALLLASSSCGLDKGWEQQERERQSDICRNRTEETPRIGGLFLADT